MTFSPSLSAESRTCRPSRLACHACRSKHLKCDGALPICGRCIVESLSCVYVPSRRGLARRTHNNTNNNNSSKRAAHLPVDVVPAVHRGSSTSSPPQPPTPRSVELPTPPGSARNQLVLSTSPSTERSDPVRHESPYAHHNDASPHPVSRPVATITPWSPRAADHDRLLSLFYSHFFRAHPFMVPKAFYAAQHYPHFLDLTVCLVGLHYLKSATLDDAGPLRHAVSSAMNETDEHTAHRVQALLLYAIVLHSSHQPKEAASCLSRAATIALAIGMNDPAFARANANDSRVVEESLRRTWWELYTVDIYLAAIHRRSTFETISATIHPLLPCAQPLYEAGHCDQEPSTLRIFADRVFSTNSRVSFSSMCYRIEAIRIVARVLSLAATDDAHADEVQALDNALASWEHHLPAVHENVVEPSGELDPMLFQARCFISCASILLHFPRSELPTTVPSVSDIACAKVYTQLAPTSGHHTIKAIAASKNLSNLAAVPWPLDRHSPLFVCGLVLGCVVQLAAASIHLHKSGLECLQQHRDRVVLLLGALQRLGDNWTLAQNAAQRLKTVAEPMFSTRHEDDAPFSEAPPFLDGAMDINESSGNPYWFDWFSEGIGQNVLFNF